MLDQFHNPSAFCGSAEGDIFFEEKPLESSGFEVQQL
jgi:hypothetical protein